jgi:hypothetical protein
MIIDQNTIMQEIYAEYPDIDQKSLDKICKKGLSGINKLMRSGFELFIKCRVDGKLDEIKFFTPMTPEDQYEVSRINHYKLSKKKDNNEAASS